MDGSSTAQFVTLSGDQNEVLNCLVLQSLLLTANFRKSNRQKIVFFSFFLFQHLTFTVSYYTAIALWCRYIDYFLSQVTAASPHFKLKWANPGIGGHFRKLKV